MEPLRPRSGPFKRRSEVAAAPGFSFDGGLGILRPTVEGRCHKNTGTGHACSSEWQGRDRWARRA